MRAKHDPPWFDTVKDDGGDIVSSAVFSQDRKRRYYLHRRWADDIDSKSVCFVMLNPSKAGARDDDPTIRRCIGFAKAWGYGEMCVVNLFSQIESSPQGLRDDACDGALQVCEELNENYQRLSLDTSSTIVLAWGSPSTIKSIHMVAVRRFNVLFGGGEKVFYCIDVNKDGSPSHPLYLRSDRELFRYIL